MKSHDLNHEINGSENGEQRLHVSYRWSTLLLCNFKSSYQNWFFFFNAQTLVFAPVSWNNTDPFFLGSENPVQVFRKGDLKS